MTSESFPKSKDSSTAIETIRVARAVRVDALRTRISTMSNCVPLVLEIGCGHGHFLTALAAARPAFHCVGVDIIAKRIESALRKCERAALPNLNFFRSEVGEFLEALPANTQIAEIYVLFPDPWPKKRHHKNRLFQASLLDHLAALSAPMLTRLHFRTDHEGYFAHASATIARHPRWRLTPELPWAFDCETIFSQRLPRHRSLTALCVDKPDTLPVHRGNAIENASKKNVNNSFTF
ncbi:MAG: methyltransferase domain-containing protein [Puniceicoccales bacterium]|nr:methyltransferase domain-containing protein [Puniceicoccales bacterium]